MLDAKKQHRVGYSTWGGVPHVDVHPDGVDEVAADGELAESGDGGVERVHAAVGGGGHGGVDAAPPVGVQAPRDLCVRSSID